MRPLVNLAGEPFRNHRIFWLVLLLVTLISAVFGANAMQTLSQLEAQIAQREPGVRALEARAAELKQAPVGVSALSPEQTRAYWAANELIVRKAFSWSQLLNEIERQIPTSVRVLRIGVNRFATAARGETEARGSVSLTLEVVGKSVAEVTKMIAGFNRSGLFTVTPQWQKPVEGTEEIEFGLEVEYQLPELRGAVASRVEVR